MKKVARVLLLFGIFTAVAMCVNSARANNYFGLSGGSEGTYGVVGFAGEIYFSTSFSFSQTHSNLIFDSVASGSVKVKDKKEYLGIAGGYSPTDLPLYVGLGIAKKAALTQYRAANGATYFTKQSDETVTGVVAGLKFIGESYAVSIGYEGHTSQLAVGFLWSFPEVGGH